MTPESNQLIRESWARVAPDSDVLGQAFYERLFEIDPDARALFARSDMNVQRTKIMQMFAEIVRMIDDPEQYVPDLAALGRRHVGYGTRSMDYQSVGAALLWSLEHALGSHFTPAARDAWAEAYRMIAGVMQRAAARMPSALTGEIPAARRPVSTS
jgi:hemoglobin-like flavoprotein